MKLKVVAMALAVFLGAAHAADAATDAEVRAQIKGLDLSPAMLYPSQLPSRLLDADAELSTDGNLVVSWDRGAVSDTDDNRVGYMSLTRAPRSQLAEDLRIVRRRGYRPRRVRVAGRRVWRLCGHVCGYAWIQSGRYYGVFGIYYVGDEDGQTLDRDQRSIIRRLAPLR